MANPGSKIFAARSLITNSVRTRDIWYIVESANWAIRDVGNSIITEINKHSPSKAALAITPRGIRNSIIHFGSLPTLFSKHGLQTPHKSCRTIATIFHIASEKHRARIIQADPFLNLIHTANRTTAWQLQELGISKDRITIIPLGVDTAIFKPTNPTQKHNLRKKLGIPQGAFLVGSFQKDGQGWGRGLEPKLEKGPDVLVKTLYKAAQKTPIHVLLSGPARGFVIKKLQEKNIPFTSLGYATQHQTIATYYQALDAYLISSRVEGGPLSLLESWATGVPVVSTSVGLISDHATHRTNALIADLEDTNTLAEHLVNLSQDKNQAEHLRQAGLEKVDDFSWPNIAQRYFKELYENLHSV